jgi:hypothetical protein
MRAIDANRALHAQAVDRARAHADSAHATGLPITAAKPRLFAAAAATL